MAVVVGAFDGRFLDGPVHPFDLTVGPRVVRLRQSVRDAVCLADHIEAHLTRPGGVAVLGNDALIGAGTVLSVEDVKRVQDVGSGMIISPNTDTAVIAATAAARMPSLPGYSTPSEAFAALSAGATALKLFPAEAVSPLVLKAQRAVLPPHVPLLVVGGVTSGNMQPWREAGANGFGLGSALYMPGSSPQKTLERAVEFVRYHRCCS